MPAEKKEKRQKLSKKVVTKDIREKLTGALADFRENLGEKEFTTRIKKASKLFSRGLDKISKKNKAGKKKAVNEELKLVPQPEQGIK